METVYYKNDYGYYFIGRDGEENIYPHWIRITTDKSADEVRVMLGEDNESGHIGDFPDWHEEVASGETLRGRVYQVLSTSLLIRLIESGEPDDEGYFNMDYEGNYLHWFYFHYDRILKFLLFGVWEKNNA